MEDKKVIFVAYAIEDERIRDVIKGQPFSVHCPFEFIDVPSKDANESDWQIKVRTSVALSDGVLAIVTKNSLHSEEEYWEIKCAQAEGIPIRGIWPYKDDNTKLGILTLVWTGSNIANWIDSL